MGYTRSSTVKLEFKDGDMAGLEVEMKRTSMGGLFEVSEAVDGLDKTRKSFERAVATLADHIVSWNFEDKAGNPVPTDFKTLWGLDHAFIRELIKGWASSLSGVAAPLETPSPDGELEASIPMDVL